jgi:hypothetical protein
VSYTVQSVKSETVIIGPNEVLTIVGATGCTATVRSVEAGTTWNVGSAETVYIGPFTSTSALVITCTVASLTYERGPAIFAQGPNVTASAAELNVSDGAPATVTLAAAAGAANVCEVTCTVKDAAGVAIPLAIHFDVWLSDAATGAGLTGTTASGTVTAKAASGIVLSTYTAKKALRVQSLGTGVFVLEITDTAKTAFYACVQNPATGATIALLLATGNYGA